MKLKQCTLCEERLPLGKFPPHRDTSDGLSWICKKCRKNYSKLYARKKRLGTVKRGCPNGHEKGSFRENGTWTCCECPNGHVDPPRYANGACKICTKKRANKFRIENPDYGKRRYRRKFIAEHGDPPEVYWARVKKESEKRWREYRWITTAKYRAKKKGIPFDLAIEDVLPLPERCPALGIPLKRNKHGKSGAPNSPSLDRIVPDRGYVKGNIRVISLKANMIKQNGTLAEIRKVADWFESVYPEDAWLDE